MKRNSIVQKLLVVAGCAAFIFSMDVSVSHAVTSSAATTGTLVAPLTISNTASLAFGKFAADASGGTLVIDTAGALTTTGSVQTITSAHTAAAFGLTGQGGLGYSIVLPASISLTGVPSGTMTIGTFTLGNTAGVVAGTTTTMAAGGTDTLYVGATAIVGASQPAGVYSGTLNVTVNYN